MQKVETFKNFAILNNISGLFIFFLGKNTLCYIWVESLELLLFWYATFMYLGSFTMMLFSNVWPCILGCPPCCILNTKLAYWSLPRRSCSVHCNMQWWFSGLSVYTDLPLYWIGSPAPMQWWNQCTLNDHCIHAVANQCTLNYHCIHAVVNQCTLNDHCIDF